VPMSCPAAMPVSCPVAVPVSQEGEGRRLAGASCAQRRRQRGAAVACGRRAGGGQERERPNEEMGGGQDENDRTRKVWACRLGLVELGLMSHSRLLVTWASDFQIISNMVIWNNSDENMVIWNLVGPNHFQFQPT
jgi:hypothetical protein